MRKKQAKKLKKVARTMAMLNKTTIDVEYKRAKTIHKSLKSTDK